SLAGPPAAGLRGQPDPWRDRVRGRHLPGIPGRAPLPARASRSPGPPPELAERHGATSLTRAPERAPAGLIRARDGAPAGRGKRRGAGRDGRLRQAAKIVDRWEVQEPPNDPPCRRGGP